MRCARLLPVAPRPFDDELLSSWRWRVASHYSSEPRQIENWSVGTSRAWDKSLLAEDFQPDQAVVRLWALACRISRSDLDRLCLQNYSRSERFYVHDPMNRGVCAACLDEDTDNGNDHYCRRSWAHVEAVICSRHRIGLENNCSWCFRRGLFQFRSIGAGVRLVCRHCGQVVSARNFVRFDQVQAALMASAVGELISTGGGQPNRVTAASRFLWSSAPSGSPYITLLELPLPFGQIPAVFSDAVAPLTTLPLAWRAVTIVGIAKLLLGRAGDIKPVEPWVRSAFRRYTDSAISGRQVSSAPIATPLIKLRSDGEYKRLAMEIVRNEGWNSVASKRGKAARKALGRMIREALSDE